MSAPAFLASQFDSMEEQAETARLGIWLFLASEILFFGGLFTAYGVYRANHRELFHYASQFLDWRLGGLNTLVLIGSSLSAAWSVRAAQLGNKRGLLASILITIGLAAVFMLVKYTEYSHKLHHGIGWGASFHPTAEALAGMGPPPAGLPVFFSIYYVMTGLHGLHVLIGMGLYAWLFARARRGDFGPGYFAPVDSVALYWHLVDLIWIFLFPLFYLIG